MTIPIEHFRMPMMYSLNQAARATGKSKSTIENALKKGTISGTKTDSGRWAIDPAELHRVYPRISEGQDKNPSDLGRLDIENVLRIKELETKLQMVGEERDRLAEQNGRLLSIVESQTTRLLAPAPTVSLWHRLFGRTPQAIGQAS